MTYRKIYPYNPVLKDFARKLRNFSTLSEVLLWNELKCKRMNGYDFHRQKPILYYIVDLFCHELELAIEIDGSSHEVEGAFERDMRRQKQIEALGINFLRFDDEEVKKDIDKVLRKIRGYIENYELMHKTEH
jgi:very-short-patch-repair endonuclease